MSVLSQSNCAVNHQQSDDWAFELQNVSKSFSHFALQDVNLRLNKGSVMGFIGPNGAGKSTTLKILMGLIQADQGRVTVLNHNLPNHQIAAKMQIGYASEDMRLYQSRSLTWHMQFIQSIFPDWDHQYAKELIERFDLTPDQNMKGLSHGQRVKAGLLLILARRPKLLLLDEPTTGLDPVARHEVLKAMMDVMLDEDRSVLFSSHNTADVEQLSDEITFIDDGKIIRSQDKESYLQSWRRIRLQLNENTLLPNLRGVIELQRFGRQAIVTTREFDPTIPQAYEKCGATVQAIEKMTLDEIFVSEVLASRKGGK